MWFVILLGIIAYLVMEHPVAFWSVFVPLGVILILYVANMFSGKRRFGFSDIYAAVGVFIVMIIALVIVAM